jgi:hypothetical protein
VGWALPVEGRRAIRRSSSQRGRAGTGIAFRASGTRQSGGLVQARLAELGKHVLEPITVEPFTKRVDGTEFGWKVDRYADGTYFINIVPGDFICNCAPWDGYDYDT